MTGYFIDKSYLRPRRIGRMGKKNIEDILQTIDEWFRNAADQGLSEKNSNHLKNLFRTNRDVFRSVLGLNGLAKVDSMRIELKPGSHPLIAKARRYPAYQRTWRKNYVDNWKST